MKLIFKLKDQKGVALLIALSVIALLMVGVTEFLFNEDINYQLAVNEKERLQAYYLAKSALNFSKIVLKYNKDAEKLLSSAGGNAAQIGVSNVEPLYKMIPLSSELLRGVLTGTSEETPSGEEGEGADDSTESSIKSGVSVLAQEEAKDFLSFEGDFSVEIVEEQTKYDLNRVYGVETTGPAAKKLDQRKKILLSILKLPRFTKFFEKDLQGREKLVHALSDWVDVNDTINEFDDVQRGSEDSLYAGEPYKVKNGKFLTLSELRLVSGMTDDLYAALLPFVTIYNSSDRLNVCWAGDETLKALILHYGQNSECVSPIDPDDEEKLTEIISAAKAVCPDVKQVAQVVRAGFGQGETDSGTPASDGGKACAFQFQDLLTSDNKVFTLKSLGTVGDTRVTITSVLNTDGNDPDKWKVNYYRIE